MQRKRILWIDDEVEFFRAHIMFLEARGYSVQPVYSGNDGLAILKKNPNACDIVLLDEQMPGKDGLTTLKEIKEMLPDLPVVMVTKSEEEDLMDRAIGKKIDGYLTKPVNPSQILMECKNLLQSQEILSDELKNSFVKSYSEINTKLQGKLNYKEWVKVYQQLVRRELDTESVDDENIRQKHFEQKIEINNKFADFVMQNYPTWLRDKDAEKPTISSEIMQKYIIPEINQNKKFALIVLDSIQLGQFVMIQRFLKKIYQNSGTYFYFSSLPTTIPHALSAFFTGLLPIDFAKERPDLWESLGDGANVLKEIVEFGLKRQNCKKKPLFFNILRNNLKTDEMMSQINAEGENKFPVVFTDFIDLLQSGKQNKFVKEVISSGKTFREMTSAWFEKSELHKLLQILSKENYTIAFTSSSGNILCTTATEYYGNASGYSNMRFRSGENIDADKRIGYHIETPEDYGLPIKNEMTGVNILNGNYYFAAHATYRENTKQQLSVFERGGVTLEEVVIPLAIMKPKNDDELEI